MRNLVLSIIALIGLYTLLRNNIGKLPDQIIWISHPNIFYKIFIPLLMTVSAISALIKKNKQNILLLSIGAMLFDFVFRLSEAVNYFTIYLVSESTSPPPEISTDPTFITINLWPSHIMGIFEIILLFLTFKYLIKNIKIETSS